MSEEKLVREMDRLVLRVPDGLKDRLSQRAKAHGRSMNSEILAMLTEIMDLPNEMELRELETERQMMLRQEHEARATLSAVQARLSAINGEIMERTIHAAGNK